MASTFGASSASLHAIKVIWASIEAFLDIQSSVAVSKTCVGLHEEIIDADTQKLKVSSLSDVLAKYHCVDGNKIEYPTPNPLVPTALNSFHFPSLRRINLGWGYGVIQRGREPRHVQNAMTSCFSLLAENIASARDLEVLQLNLWFDVPYTQRIKSTLDRFGRNLSACKKLKEIKIFSSEEYHADVLRHFMSAVVPTILDQSKMLRQFHFYISKAPQPESVAVGPLQMNTPDFVSVQFFAAILSCASLSSLLINVPKSLFLSNALLEAASLFHLHSTDRPLFSELTYLDINIVNSGREASLLEPASGLLGIFLDCEQIQDINLSFPASIWKNDLKASRGLLCGKPMMSHLFCQFGRYDDSGGKVLQLLEDCILENRNGICVEFEDLERVEGNRFFDFVRKIKSHEKIKSVDGYGVKSTEDETYMEGQMNQQVALGEDINQGHMPANIDIHYWGAESED